MDASSLWARLERCGRLPQAPGAREAQLQVIMQTWLGDYSSAAAALAASSGTLELVPDTEEWRVALAAALRRLLLALPAAEASSVAFVPRRLAKAAVSSVPGVRLLTGAFPARDGTELGYVLMVRAEEDTPSRAAEAAGRRALLLRWGGNAEVAGLTARSPDLCSLVADGLADVLLLDYRGFGWSGGSPSMATLRGDTQDVFAALPAVMAQHGCCWPPAGPMVVVGRSIGGLCALHAAAQGHGNALLLDSPVNCHWPLEGIESATWDALDSALSARLTSASREFSFCHCCSALSARHAQSARERCYLDPQDLLRSIDLPLLFINGTADVVCPKEQAEKLFQAAASADKTMLWVKDRGHNEVMSTDAYWNAVEEFLGRLLSRWTNS